MKKVLSFIMLLLLAFLAGTVSGQKKHNNITRVLCADSIETFVSTPVYFDITPPLRQMKEFLPKKEKMEKEKREIENRVNTRYGGLEPFILQEDPVWQKQDGTYLPQTPGPIANFEGVGNLSGVMPPDTQGDVGTDKYIQVVNSNFAVYSKAGAVVMGPLALHTIWQGIPYPWSGRDDGDPIVLYDQAAQRWLISQFALPTGQQAILVAISQTSDPTGSWYRYVFNFTTTMPDYPKFGVWPDGYYVSFNQFNGSSGVGACALDRAKMLIGDPTALLQYKNLTGLDPDNMLPSDWDGATAPPAGEPNYFTYFNDWTVPSAPTLKIWSFHADWTTPANTTFALTSTLTPAAFSSFFCSDPRGRCLPQPNTTSKLESLSDRLMYRLQYRNFGSYQAMVTNHTVNVDGAGHAGIRWYELRNTGAAGWSIFQQGTYAPDLPNRWMGSAAMNALGDIALGYTVANASIVYPSIRYTGRHAADPPGQMTISEQTLIAGTGSQTYAGVGRWGDYSMMSVDPSDDLTFWFTTEYVQTSGDFNWQTRVGSFRFSDNPTLNTLDATAITPATATLNGTIIPNGLNSTYNFEWGNTTAYGSNTPVTSAGSGTANVDVNATLTGLSGGTTCHFRLTGVNSAGNTNANDMFFTPGGAILTTTEATAITPTTATSGGIVVSDGGGAVSARGVCWSTSANPTISDNHTTDGSGLGTFTSSITGLASNTLYHIRAYATNSYGTFYGINLSFTTQCGSFFLPFSELFNGTLIPTCWSQVDHQGNGQIWKFGVVNGGLIHLTGNYTYLNSRAFGSGNTQNVDLVSPVFDCSAFTDITMAFEHYFQGGNGSSGTLSYTIDAGNTWTVIQTYVSSTTNPASFYEFIPGANGQSQVQFRWNYTGTYGYYWAFNNLSITGTQTSTLSVTPSNQNVPASPAGSTSFAVTSNVSWSASCDSSWLTVTPSGTGDGTIDAAFLENPYYVSRTAAISVTVAGLPPQLVTVSQAQSTVSVSETDSDAIHIIPNPSKGTFRIDMGKIKFLPLTVSVLDNSGRIIMHKVCFEKRDLLFDLSSAQEGFYFVKVTADDRKMTRKLLLKH
ncbi:MAG: BACON domain-containing protein [Bacteroidales bacterium]